MVMTQSQAFLFPGGLDEFWRTLYADLPRPA
jgi:hypothetical protein